ncbi:MAG: hypothetical protein NXI28_15245 [bacterium]|nr:hypothetical protein [bacterium]
MSVQAVEDLRAVLMDHFEGDAILDNVTADAVTAMRRMQATITQRLDGELTKLRANDDN